MTDFNELTIQIGGYFGPREMLRISGMDSDPVAEYYHSEEGPFDLRYTLPLSSKDVENIRKAVEDCNIHSWKHEYVNLNILDGEQWSVELGFPDTGEKLTIRGDNAYPAEWKEFLKLKNKIVRKCMRRLPKVLRYDECAESITDFLDYTPLE